MEMARGVAEHKTLFHVGSQGNFIGEVKVCLNGQCAAIYEGIAVMERGSVGQYRLTPVYRFISADGRHAAIEVEGLRVVAQQMQVVADLASELRHRDTPFFAVWLVGLEILAAESPCVGVAFEHGVIYSERIAFWFSIDNDSLARSSSLLSLTYIPTI